MIFKHYCCFNRTVPFIKKSNKVYEKYFVYNVIKIYYVIYYYLNLKDIVTMISKPLQ